MHLLRAGWQCAQQHRPGGREPCRAGARSRAAERGDEPGRATSRRALACRAWTGALKFESATETLKRLEGEIAELRAETAGEARRRSRCAARGESAAQRTGHADRTPRFAGIADPRSQLLHRNSAETVAPGAPARTDSTPVGTLADFIEVSGAARRRGRRVSARRTELRRREELGCGRRGRAGAEDRRGWPRDISDSSRGFAGKFSFAADGIGRGHEQRAGRDSAEGCIRVLNGFGRSLEMILPKLRDGYLTETAGTGAVAGARKSPCLFPDARGRVLPQRDRDGRQAARGRSAGAEARTARDREAARLSGARTWSGGDRGGGARQARSKN